MNRPHPAQQMNFPISINLYQQLLGAAHDTGFKKEYWEIGADALADWLRRHKPDAIAMAKAAGYQWKQVFLPNGTLLRTVFNGKNHHCTVEDDQVLYEGRSVSPSGFVNAVGGIRRNAWKCLWVLLPDQQTWTLADSLRPPKRPGRERTRKLSMPAPEGARASERAASPRGVHDAPRRLADENASAPPQPPQPPQPPRPMRAPRGAAQVATRREQLRSTGQRPHLLDDIGSAAATAPLRAPLPRSDDRRAGASDRRLGDNETLGAMVREAFLAFSRSKTPIQR